MNSFKKIIDLMRKTGDRAIILDETGEPMGAIVSMTEYERLVLPETGKSRNLTESEILDRINNDIIALRELKENEETITDSIENKENHPVRQNYFSPSHFEPKIEPKEVKTEEDHYYFEPVE